MTETLWKPSEESIKRTNMTAFTRWLSRQTGKFFPNYQELHQWSVENLEVFWPHVLEYSHIIYSQPYQQVLNTPKMPGSKWFCGMHLNFAQNIFANNFQGPALISQIEPAGDNTALPGQFFTKHDYPQLQDLVAKCAAALQNAGIEKGDRVAGYVANVPEAIIACLACASLGAVWSSASPDFGLEALCDRFTQIKPKVVFASSHYRYNGKTYHTDKVIHELKNRIPVIELIVTVPYPVDEPTYVADLSWHEFLNSAGSSDLQFVQVPFDHPLYILFSSGTSGPPKAIVHGTGGTLLQHKKELSLHSDIKPHDRLLYFTTCGWMMWNWQLSALTCGATICLYDGSPAYPNLTAIWRLVDQLGVTHFGTSGRFIESCMKSQPTMSPGSLGDLRQLRTILYTGSPLSSNGFRWIYDTIKEDVHLAGISGGTDIVSCFVLGNPNLPVVAGEIQCKGLGVDVVALDENGDEVINEPGELVCRQPLPSMPTGFLDDPDGEKYRQAYFDVYPGLWRHGDYVQFMPDGGVIIYGRSDATLNPGGVRIGSAEIYSALDHLGFISGAVVVGWQPPEQSDEVVVLCVALKEEGHLTEVQKKTIRRTIREKCSPRHVPHHIFQVSGVPVTRSGKTVELSVKAILAGKSVSNRNALANPQVLDEFERIRDQLHP